MPPRHVREKKRKGDRMELREEDFRITALVFETQSTATIATKSENLNNLTNVFFVSAVQRICRLEALPRSISRAPGRVSPSHTCKRKEERKEEKKREGKRKEKGKGKNRCSMK